MTTADRPTWAPVKRGNEQDGTTISGPSQKYSSTLKPRKEGQDTQEELQRRNLREELEERERTHCSSKDKTYTEDMDRRTGTGHLLEGGKRDAEDQIVPLSIDADDSDIDVKSEEKERKEGQDTQEELQRRNLREELEERERRHFSSKDKTYTEDMDRRTGTGHLLEGGKRDVEDQIVPPSIYADDSDIDVKSEEKESDDGDEALMAKLDRIKKERPEENLPKGSLFNPSLNNKVSQSSSSDLSHSSTSSNLSHRSTSSQPVERQQKHTSQRTIGASPERDSRSKSEKGSFDIFGTTKVGLVKLKDALHVTNKEKRRDSERFKNAPEPQYLRSGMVLLKNFISIPDQVKILNKCRELGIGSGGFYRPGYRNGTKLHLQMMCLGKDWDPDSKLYKDSRLLDNAVPPEIPGEFKKLVDDALQTVHNFPRRSSKSVEEIPNMSPDVCIVNFYDNSGKLGLHQDIDESKESLLKGLPVVSLSVGDSAEFLYGDVRDADKAEKVMLESGDVLIFGGKSRLIFHGVSSVKPNTAPKFLTNQTAVRPGRLNLTFRQV